MVTHDVVGETAPLWALRALSAVVGFLVGLFHVAATGVLSIQSAGALDGAVINLNNEVVGVESPATPLLEWFATALLGVIVFFVFSEQNRYWSTLSRLFGVTGFVTSSLGLCTYAVALGRDDVPGTASALTELGWKGWVQEGGMSSATHLLVALVAVSAFAALRQKHRVANR